jgi:hypothetical protein
LAFINQTYKRSFPSVNLSAIAAVDPALSYKRPGNGRFNGQQLHLSIDQPSDGASDNSDASSAASSADLVQQDSPDGQSSVQTDGTSAE